MTFPLPPCGCVNNLPPYEIHRPRTIQGPVCAKRQPKLTKFDGWFLKFFPYDNKGKTPKEVDITQTMLPETVVVPLKYQVVNMDDVVLEETPLELVAGIVGVLEDPDDYTMTPKIGWFVRTVKEADKTDIQIAPVDVGQSHNPDKKSDEIPGSVIKQESQLISSSTE